MYMHVVYINARYVVYMIISYEAEVYVTNHVVFQWLWQGDKVVHCTHISCGYILKDWTFYNN